MISAWTKHLKNAEEKLKFNNSLLGSKHIFDRMKTLLQEEEDKLDLQDRSISSYDSPSWAHKQADNNGYRRCLAMIKKLIHLDHKEPK